MSTQGHWATHFYVGDCQQHTSVLSTLLPYVEDDSYFVEPWIYSNCQSTCQSPKNNEIPWNVFFEAIRPNVEEYLESLNPTCQFSIKSTEVWMNKYYKHGYQEIHDHAFPNRSFGCAYILELPEGNDAGGQLVFENTNFPIIQSTGLNRIFNAFNYEKFIPILSPGTIVIFPSWAKHYVLPNKTDERRTSITANFFVEGIYK